MKSSFGSTCAMVGIFIALASGAAYAQDRASDRETLQPTFAKDVMPILQEHCQVCHRPGTFAPMSLMTYEEARPWARSIRQKVLAREMPPWFIDKNVGVQHFNNDASLTDEQIALIAKWSDNGAPKGKDSDM